MNNEAPTVTVAESVPAPEVLPSLADMTATALGREVVEPKSETPAIKEPPAPAQEKEETTDAAGSEPAKEAQDKDKSHRQKTPETSERRFADITSENKRLRERVEALETSRKQDPAPAKEPSPSLKAKAEEWFKANPGKDYEDYMALQIQQGIQAERQRQQQEHFQREFNTRVAELSKQHPQAGEMVTKAGLTIHNDEKISPAVKSMISESDNFVDLLHVLGGEESALSSFLELAHSNPREAIKKIVLAEQLIVEERGGKKETPAPKTETGRDESGKFAKAPEPKETSAPPPPSEVGGRGTAPVDPLDAEMKAHPGRLSKTSKEVMLREYSAGR